MTAHVRDAGSYHGDNLAYDLACSTRSTVTLQTHTQILQLNLYTEAETSTLS